MHQIYGKRSILFVMHQDLDLYLEDSSALALFSLVVLQLYSSQHSLSQLLCGMAVYQVD